MKIDKVLIAFLLAGVLSAAQDAANSGATITSATSEKTDRKLIYRVDPVYPQDLKRFYIGGTVKLRVRVSARGAVESVSPLGGNPALVESSVTAVKKWKYAPADMPTDVLLNLVFTPRNN